MAHEHKGILNPIKVTSLVPQTIVMINPKKESFQPIYFDQSLMPSTSPDKEDHIQLLQQHHFQQSYQHHPRIDIAQRASPASSVSISAALPSVSSLTTVSVTTSFYTRIIHQKSDDDISINRPWVFAFIQNGFVHGALVHCSFKHQNTVQFSS